MKPLQLLTSLLIISFALFTLPSCEKKEEVIPEAPFELLGTWNFNQVMSSAPIVGDYTDSDPTGTITFNEDGTGSADFSFDVVGALGQGIPVSRNDTFTWTKTETTITLVDSNNENTVWTIVNEADSDFQVTWTESVLGLDAVDTHAFMSK